ncbi:hypothetical protein DL766_006791 [Monosporascus sp. MC13-8B]|uniref:Ecp2 effector protein domain-containing protein n=1 Tax=Monosporascus cannonballus TaxID=155416 RepID=A0ABY0GZL8_9PEZI|nr:hypothetical protein DL762_007281 [Monosporascus cannonballus]RYO86777.1 hypothetical protein DL763_006567 [Monosporascus cannonballus]RYP26167.1 hypothetical protein DL766_006791 [Monosporascus sp. MC13-8B]
MHILLQTLPFWGSALAAAIVQTTPRGISIHNVLPEGYATINITWKGFESVHGFEGIAAGQTFGGSIQDVTRQLKKFGDPERVFPSMKRGCDIAVDKEPPSDNREVTCRSGGGGPVSQKTINDGISYLKSLPDDLRCGNQPPEPGKGACGRISCSYHAAIWWCNHNTHTVKFKCNLFAKYAQNLVDKCSYPLGKSYTVQGQDYDRDFAINTVVGWDEC